ncbi:hypothetical protein QWZ13_16375 [Reinekea marina]|uniref:hypothetical protein n=1 Tax=Reinekea marina TaxID=1310421 RepID=UPI0025B42DBE|nr:hypothetical protein [Reinekea marina]MDN3650484.1 hypothetical protein [Reinekea marina]
MLLKLLILPIYLLLPFTLYLFDNLSFWLLPFAIWLALILINAAIENYRNDPQ